MFRGPVASARTGNARATSCYPRNSGLREAGSEVARREKSRAPRVAERRESFRFLPVKQASLAFEAELMLLDQTRSVNRQ